MSGLTKYYQLLWLHLPKVNVAYTDQDLLDAELILKLKDQPNTIIEFDLRGVEEGSKKLKVGKAFEDFLLWIDYQPNNLAWPLMSQKMSGIVKEYSDLNVRWLSANVKHSTELRSYEIPMFLSKKDVLDSKATVYAGETDLIVKPVLNYSKIKGLHFFPMPLTGSLWQITPSLFVSEELKDAIQRAAISGVDFREVKATD